MGGGLCNFWWLLSRDSRNYGSRSSCGGNVTRSTTGGANGSEKLLSLDDPLVTESINNSASVVWAPLKLTGTPNSVVLSVLSENVHSKIST